MNAILKCRGLCRVAILACATFVLALGLMGCAASGETSGSGGASGSSSAAESASKTPPQAQIAYEEIEWKVDSAVVDGVRRVGMTYTNNSPYKILSVDLRFSAKPDLTDEQLGALSSMEYLDDPVASLMDGGMNVENYTTVEAGATSQAKSVSCGGYYIKSMDQYELVQPDLMRVTFATDDGWLFAETIDCLNGGTVSMNGKAVNANQWGDGDLAKTLPRPEDMLIANMDESTSSFSFDAYDVTAEEFTAYVDTCKAAGFTTESESDENSYEAVNADGTYQIDLYYYASSMHMDAEVEKLKTNDA